MTKSLLQEGYPLLETEQVTGNQGTTYTSYLPFYYRSTNGGETASFRKKIRNKELIPMQWFRQQELSCTFSSAGYSYTQYYDQALTSVAIQFSNPGAPTWLYDTLHNVIHLEPNTLFLFAKSNLSEVLLQEVAAALVSPTHDTLTFLAELNKLKSLFGKALANLVSLLKNTSPTKWASYWLELRYGWRVLYYDLKSIDQAIKNINRQATDFFSRKRTGTTVHQASKSVPYSYINWYFSRDYTLDVDISVRATGIARVAPPNFGGNLVTTAWELVPFSFVLDWFFTFGKSIATAIALGSVDAVYGIGYSLDARGSSILRKTAEDPYKYYSGNGRYYVMHSCTADSQFTGTAMMRDPARPSIFPQFLGVSDLDGAKILDLLSLLAVTLSGSRR